MKGKTPRLKGTRIFYPEVSKTYEKWAETAGENPIIMNDSGFETFLAGWQAHEKRATPALTPEARAEYNRLKDLEPDSLMRYVEAFQDAMKLLDSLIAAGKVR